MHTLTPHTPVAQPHQLGQIQNIRRIGVVGLGYVGLPLAIAASKKGFTVVGFDTDEEKIQELQQGHSSIVSQDELSELKKSTTIFESHLNELALCNAYILCVPTPVHEDKTPDVTAVTQASRTIGSLLDANDIVLVESTIQPGMSEDLIIPILEQESGLTVEKDFMYAYCPERINPGDSSYFVSNIPRVIGATGERSMALALSIYGNILDAPLKPMANVKEAESVKMVENAFRDINIAYVNELALAFEKEGIDVVNVIDGAATKPFGFMAHYPSCGVGGHCIPVDPYYLIRYGEKHGFTHQLLSTAREINESMPRHSIELLENALDELGVALHDQNVAVLGLSYKKDIDDMRESPAEEIIKLLKNEGVRVTTYDPHVPELSTASSLAEALDTATAVIIATDHLEFTSLSPQDFLLHDIPVIIDGKNCLDKETFDQSPLIYRGIGRTHKKSPAKTAEPSLEHVRLVA